MNYVVTIDRASLRSPIIKNFINSDIAMEKLLLPDNIRINVYGTKAIAYCSVSERYEIRKTLPAGAVWRENSVGYYKKRAGETVNKVLPFPIAILIGGITSSFLWGFGNLLLTRGQ